MLPSTGYFKGLNCPFYDKGLCERPYCHFRHVKKDSQNNGNDGIENGPILLRLAPEKVKKALLETYPSGSSDLGQYLNTDRAINDGSSSAVIASKHEYNPTPISELNKIRNTDNENDVDPDQRRRHIPVPYTPRKPANYAIKRPLDINGSSKPFIYIPPETQYTPGSSAKVDPYTPIGSVDTQEKYLPGSEKEIQEYSPEDKNTNSTSSYIPSDKKKKILEYKPKKLNAISNIPTVTYHPTPLSQVPCFSSDEDEPATKKSKSLGEVNALDNLDNEFEMLGQILDEERKPGEEPNTSKDKCSDSNMKIINLCEETAQVHKKCAEKEESSMKQNNKQSGSDGKSSSKGSSKENTRDKNKIKNSDINTSKSSKNHEKSKIKDKESSSKESSKSESSKNDTHNSKSSRKDDSKMNHRSSSKHSGSSSSKQSDKNSRHTESNHKTSSSNKDNSRKDEKKNIDRDKHKKDKYEKDRHSKNKKDKHSKNEKDISKCKKDKKSSSNKRTSNHKHRINSDQSSDECAVHSDHPHVDDIELIDEVSESDEESIALECKKIFEEYVPTSNFQHTKQTMSQDVIEDEYIPTKKRISHTVDKNIKVAPRAHIKPDFKVNAAQAMAERLARVREYHATKNTLPPTESVTKPEISKSIISPGTSSKIRIAYVPYASTLVNAKKNILSKSTELKPTTLTNQTTTVQTIPKGLQRVAHIPNEKFIDRPGVLEPLASKIPANIRSTYLNMMIDQCLKIYLVPADAYTRAQHEELTTSKKCMSVQIYKNSALLTISRLKKEIQESNGVKKSATDCLTLQKLPGSDCNKVSAPSWSIESRNRKNSVDEFKGVKLYENIKKWILSEEQLRENGFPRPHENGEKGRAMIYVENKKQKPPKGYIRTCCRCNKEYKIDKKGFPVTSEECIYHPNNKYRFRGEVKYQCCSQDASSDGCSVAPNHVFEYVDYQNLKGYVKTMHPERELDDYGVYALDCEMCYTTHGLDLTRVTVIDSACKTVYETLVKPLHAIIDYNTRYSGITEEQMTGVSTTLLEVQATLLTMFSSKTILIGHSLESDFKALKLIHDTVIDTSVLFPHKMGPPYKRALRNLSSEHLRKIIQNSVDGHNSAEDATVCMELIHFKLKEDLKTR
ncbi:RNA exonuclease 1 homolog [Eumeta japonica]|uniref:RNA exonuclease 1 homolog n=1 Tax=Eumeta variegata TaxID=151549 RepID=A0A4C1TLW5_EUMVA|nr:RNA exonuclease 1 homolog [Eumeta japonica]